jgi:hypothetical protein
VIKRFAFLILSLFFISSLAFARPRMVYKILVSDRLGGRHVIYTSFDPVTYWSLNGGRVFIEQLTVLGRWTVEDNGVLYAKDLRATEPAGIPDNQVSDNKKDASNHVVRAQDPEPSQPAEPQPIRNNPFAARTRKSSSQDKELAIRSSKSNTPKNPRAELNRIAREIARRYDIPPNLLKALIQVESGWNPHAVSNKGAKGLTQLTDATAKALGVKDVFDPWQNIEAGARYLRMQMDRFRDLKLALAAYNCGPGRVARGTIPNSSIRFAESVLRLKTILDSADEK